MNLEKFVFYNKWVSYIGIGALGPLVAGLGQWADSGMWPPAINWICILAGCGIGLLTQNLSFFSSAWQTMLGKLNGNGTTIHQVTETTQTVDKPAANPVDAAPPKV